MTKEKALNEIMKAVKYEIDGYDNAELVKAILGVFEKQVRIDQLEKDRELSKKILKLTKIK